MALSNERRLKVSEESKLYRYRVYITEGGLMEDPAFHNEHYETIEAESTDRAVEIWLGLHPTYNDPNYLKQHEDGAWTYWGWRIHADRLMEHRS